MHNLLTCCIFYQLEKKSIKSKHYYLGISSKWRNKTIIITYWHHFKFLPAGLCPANWLTFIYLWWDREHGQNTEREGDKEISKYIPLLLLKGGKSRELSKGGGKYKDPPSKCKKSALHNIFQVTFWSSQWPPCQIAWSLFSPLICHTWLFFRQRFESFANDSVTFRLHVTEDSICTDLACYMLMI